MAPWAGALLLPWLLDISEVTAAPTPPPPPIIIGAPSSSTPGPPPIIVGAPSSSTPAPGPAPSTPTPSTLAPTLAPTPPPNIVGPTVAGSPTAPTTVQATVSPATTCLPTNLTAYGDLVVPICENFTKAEGFNPACLPGNLSTYTMLAGMGSGKEPFVYNSWIFSEVCGLRMAAWRALYQQPRRKVICKGTEAILENWGVYLVATCCGVLLMNVFYVSFQESRCWGCFRARDPCWGITYQKVVACILVFLFFPIALALLGSLIYQFIHQLYIHHQAINGLMGPVCYSPFLILDPKPAETCKDIMRTDWISSLDMLKIMMLGIFSLMESLFIFGVACYTSFLCLMSALRIFCCCCGCTVYHAACHRPDCMCGKYFACKLCFCWNLCHPLACLICNGCFIPVVLLLYFLVTVSISVLAYGLLWIVFIAIIWGLAQCIKTLIACSGSCRILPTPSYFEWYVMVLNTLPTTYIRNFHFHEDKDEEQKKMMAEIYGEPHNPSNPAEWDIDNNGYEIEKMGTPCPPLLMSAFPIPVLVVIIPIVMVVFFAGITFAYQDYLTHTLAWADADMRWYYTKPRMYDGTKMWIWWWQVFEALAGGLTDALIEVFHAWWWCVKGAVTFDSSFYSTVGTFLGHGANPINLFQTQFFYKFRAAAIFWRFMLAFIFAITRSIAMINMPFEVFMADLSNPANPAQFLTTWDDQYAPTAQYENVPRYG